MGNWLAQRTANSPDSMLQESLAINIEASSHRPSKTPMAVVPCQGGNDVLIPGRTQSTFVRWGDFGTEFPHWLPSSAFGGGGTRTLQLSGLGNAHIGLAQLVIQSDAVTLVISMHLAPTRQRTLTIFFQGVQKVWDRFGLQYILTGVSGVAQNDAGGRDWEVLGKEM